MRYIEYIFCNMNLIICFLEFQNEMLKRIQEKVLVSGLTIVVEALPFTVYNEELFSFILGRKTFRVNGNWLINP